MGLLDPNRISDRLQIEMNKPALTPPTRGTRAQRSNTCSPHWRCQGRIRSEQGAATYLTGLESNVDVEHERRATIGPLAALTGP